MTTLKYAARALMKAPFMTAVAVVSVALGIGANVAIFSIFDEMLLRSLPVQEPERLVNLANPGLKFGSTSCGSAGSCDEVFSYLMFRDLEEAETGFSGLAAHRTIGVNLSLAGRTVNGEGLLVSGGYFPTLGVRPGLGRLLSPIDDENIGEHYVAVLGHDYWVRELGADPGVLNQTLIVNGLPMTVVGVAPDGFDGTTLGKRPDVYLPLTMREVLSPFWSGFDNRRSYWIYVFGRLAPGVTLEQADAQINALYAGIINDVEAPLQTGMSDQQMEQFRARRLILSEGHRGQSNMHGDARTPLIILFCITGLVLLIACANVANLLLARGARRAAEMAIRGSLGAPRRTLVGQLLTESVLLGALGGIASILVAYWTLGVMAGMLPPEEAQTMSFGLRPSVFVFTAALALGTGVLFGLYPAFHSTRRDLVGVIKANAGQPSGSRSAKRFRGSLVTAQIALSMTLLVVAGLFIMSLANVSRVELGIASDNLVAFSVAPVLNGYEPERSGGFFQQLEEELAAIPGVTQVSAALVPLLTGESWGNSVRVEGFENEDPEVDRGSRYNQVGPGYLATLGMPLIAGREFGIIDVAGAPPVAIVNEAFTRKFNLGGRDAVGKYMAEGGGDDLDIQIVGVVQDATYNDVKVAVPPLYLRPYKQEEILGFLTFYVRTATDPAPVLRSIPDVVRRLDPNLPVTNLKRMQDQIRENTVGDRMISILAAGFATLATLLAAIGLYGVLAYTVAQRTREIGLRMALGADRVRVQAMVLRQVSIMLALGGLLGLLTSFGLSGVAESILFGVERLSVPPMIAAAGLLAVVAYGAGYLPARRASRVDPMDALRQD